MTTLFARRAVTSRPPRAAILPLPAHGDNIVPSTLIPGPGPLSVGVATVEEPGAHCESGETMTTLENRPDTALLVIDVQNGVVAEGS